MDMKTENWNGHEIRFVEKEPGEWWGIAKDVADVLRYSNTAVMTRHLKPKYVDSVIIDVTCQSDRSSAASTKRTTQEAHTE